MNSDIIVGRWKQLKGRYGRRGPNGPAAIAPGWPAATISSPAYCKRITEESETRYPRRKRLTEDAKLGYRIPITLGNIEPLASKPFRR